eukprot:SM000076S21789  [mRNA]  locus=s76:253116:253613:+ [translate_table: standard]
MYGQQRLDLRHTLAPTDDPGLLGDHQLATRVIRGVAGPEISENGAALAATANLPALRALFDSAWQHWLAPSR